MNGQTHNSPEYEEVDFRDYVEVLFRRKVQIFAVFLVSVGGAVLVSLYLPRAYTIETVLEVGRFGMDGEAQEQVVGKIESDVYGLQIRETLNVPENRYPEIRVKSSKDAGLVVISITSSETDLAKRILEAMNDLILAEHRQERDVQRTRIENDIKAKKALIALAEDDLERMKKRIAINEIDIQITGMKAETIRADIERIKNKIRYSEEEKQNLEQKVAALQEVLVFEQTPGTQFALFDAKENLASKRREIEDLHSTINDLLLQIENIRLSANALDRTKEDYGTEVNSLKARIESYNTDINALETEIQGFKSNKVVKQPAISEQSVSPRLLLNIALAGVLGFFLGVFAAFAREWWEKSNPVEN